jgi:hypothetical protein
LNESILMLVRTVLAVAAVLLIVGPSRAKDLDCPIDHGAADPLWKLKEDAIRKAPTCKQAYEIMQACAYGATGDRGLSTAVHEKCEPLFLPKLSNAQRRAYNREQKRCDDQYANKDGSMYRSLSAFCDAESAVAYAAKYGTKGKRP